MTQRDPSTGQFRKASPQEKVAAHVEKVNARHFEHPRNSIPNICEQYHHVPGANGNYWTSSSFPGEKFYRLPQNERRSQRIEYDDDRQVWPWVLATGFVVFILVAAIWVMTH